ncbi:MAG: calcium/sodium antiporter [Candidatus Aenigmarchaeota archaeon]|nr:calcium/sodium antiporter [Candidatus Aenigmarchaeota archaeon]
MKISRTDRIFILIIALSLIAALISGSGVSLSTSLLVAGLAILIKGADFLVDGGSEIAEHYGISHMIIGLTIVAFGTSMPEFMVSVYASFIGSGGISVGNIVGSNIFNILIVLGLPAIISPLLVKEATGFDSKFMMLAATLLFILSFGLFETAMDIYIIGAIDGIILLACFAFYLWKTLGDAKKQKEAHSEERKKRPPNKRMPVSILMVIIGIAGIGLGGQMLVDNGRSLAYAFGIPELIIGLTLMAFGTSLPELAASVISAMKKKHDITIGNVIGSNIFNILLVGGAAALVRPISDIASRTVFIEIPFMIFVSLLLIVFMKTGSRITRNEGILFIALFAAFMGYLLL